MEDSLLSHGGLRNRRAGQDSRGPANPSGNAGRAIFEALVRSCGAQALLERRLWDETSLEFVAEKSPAPRFLGLAVAKRGLNRMHTAYQNDNSYLYSLHATGQQTVVHCRGEANFPWVRLTASSWSRPRPARSGGMAHILISCWGDVMPVPRNSIWICPAAEA